MSRLEPLKLSHPLFTEAEQKSLHKRLGNGILSMSQNNLNAFIPFWNSGDKYCVQLNHND